jgi:hypothetical protein
MLSEEHLDAIGAKILNEIGMVLITHNSPS